MKSKYLDIRNCHQLLPHSHRLPMIAKLDECLDGINTKQGPLNGSIDLLIKQNEKTFNQEIGSDRFCSSPIDVAQALFVKEGSMNTQAIIRGYPGPAQLHTIFSFENDLTQKTLVPLQYLLKGWGEAGKGHQCYIHSITKNPNDNMDNSDAESYYYVGITGRNWLQRLEEHIREMRQGNRRLFYEVWRELHKESNIYFIASLREVNMSYEEAMKWEEMSVDKVANDKYGLNMIPGGYKGLKYLHECRIINNMNISLEEREHAIAEYATKHPRSGIPNPYIAELWKDDGFYQKVMESKEKTLSADQVRKIRELNKQGMSIDQIKKEVDALNELQVKNVISGKYYSRISD